MGQRNVLYRFFDENDVLLYVGISMTPWERFRQHRAEKPWWDDIRKTTMEPYPDRSAVREAERAAILAERPMHNIQHNRTHVVVDRPMRLRGKRYSFLDRAGNERRGELTLVFEVEGDPISDDYNARWDSPRDVFNAWRDRYLKARERSPLRYPSDFVPITWYITGGGTFESAHPGNYSMYDEDVREWWGDFYTRPYDMQEQRFIDDVKEIPVAHKRWTDSKQDKGGFIFEATGWKPFPLQRWVSLADLSLRASQTQRQAS